MRRILLGVDDSPAGLAATRTAVQLAVECTAELLAVHVIPRAADRASSPAGEGRGSDAASIAVLRFAVETGSRAGVTVEALAVEGEPARHILDLAAAWPADVIVLGRSTGRRVGAPYIGSKVQHVLEFADVPVLVVPPPPGR